MSQDVRFAPRKRKTEGLLHENITREIILTRHLFHTVTAVQYYVSPLMQVRLEGRLSNIVSIQCTALVIQYTFIQPHA